MQTYFPKLDSIRFYAFLIVFISHSYFNSKPQLLQLYPELATTGDSIFAHGEIGVQVFFMLSGFLIMYLALKQIVKNGTFSVRTFLKRRILRIWPLYFLVIALSYGLYLFQGSKVDLGCTHQFLYFLGNFCIQQGVPDVISSLTIAPLWSVSVEEQFYIVFPFVILAVLGLFKKIGKYALYVAGLLGGLVYVYALYMRYVHAQDWSYISYASVSALPALLSGMALAGAAHVFPHSVAYIKKHAVYILSGAAILFASGFYIKFFGNIGVSLYVIPIYVATACAIMYCLSPYVEKKMTLISRVSRYGGRISYGLYVYHMFAILLVNAVFGNSEFMYTKIVFSLLLTGVFAHISYTYIEKWFLKFK